MPNDGFRLVVVPTDPIHAYEAKGLTWFGDYVNPAGIFGSVHAVSPLEQLAREIWGMTVRPCRVEDFPSAVRAIRPDVIRAYGAFGGAEMVVGKRVEGVPIIVSVHDTMNVSPAVLLADKVICMSQAVADIALGMGCADDRVSILPNRVDLSLFRPFDPIERENAALDLANKFRPGRCLLHIGRKAPQKNLDTLLEAMPSLDDDIWVLAVGIEETPDYREQVANLGLTDRIHWVPMIPNDQLPRIYNAVTAMVVPSRWEGFGVVFIEAAACGTPIVTSRIEPMTEYLTHERHALLVEDYEDPKALADAIEAVLSNDWQKTLRMQSRQAALPFDKGTIDSLECDMYRQIIGRPARSYNAREGVLAGNMVQAAKEKLQPQRGVRRRISKIIGRRADAFLRSSLRRLRP